jgi:hypothetical protein
MKNMITQAKSTTGNLKLFRSLIVFSVLAVNNAFAQSPPKDLMNSIVPPSPNAAALGKYGEVPVSLYTGVANISIPIYELKGNDISVPISLSYHPSGIRLDEESSWIGLGWALNAGGVITRSVAGVNDDDPNYGYLNTPAIPAKLLDFVNLTGQQAIDNGNYLYNVTLNQSDPEPDVYFYNFNGYSGKFVFDATGVPQTIPASTLRIEVNPHETPLTTFTMVTPEGVRYKFGGTGYVEKSTPEYGKYSDQYAFISKTKLHQTYNSAWYLTEIKTPGGETVSFTYTPERIYTESNYSQSRFIDFNSFILTQFSNNSTIINTIDGLRLTKINFNTSEIEFYTNTVRQDLNTVNAKALEKIIIRQNGIVLSNFVFNTSYFQSSGSGYLSKRLKLNGIQEFSADLTQSKPAYLFTYDETVMSPRNSFSQDHWGFYNGKSNPCLIPDINSKQKEIIKSAAIFDNQTGAYLLQDAANTNFVTISDKNKTIRFTGADREPQFPAMRALSLTKIVYPTGGYTNFTYEPHDYKLPAPIYVYKALIKEANANSITLNTQTTDVNLVQEIQNISNADPNKPYYATVDIGFSALPYMQQLKLCPLVKPKIYFQDLTTGVTIINFQGIGTAPSPTVDPAAGSEYSMEAIGSGWTIYDVKLNPTHAYRLFAEMYPCDQLPPDPYYSSIKLSLSIPTTQIQAYNGAGGGLRISMIESGGNASASLVKKFVYKKFGEVNAISSGVLGQVPVYMELNQTANTGITTKTYESKVSAFKKASDNNLFSATATYTPVMAIYSGSRYVLGQTSGNAIGYTEVQEWICDNVNATAATGGKIIHKFTSFNDNPDVNPTLLGLCFTGGINPFVSKADPQALDLERQYTPFANPVSYDYKRGLVTDEEYRNSADVVVRKVHYTYNPVDELNNLRIIEGIKVVDLTQRGDGGHDLIYAKYSHRAAWNYLSQKTETTYDLSGASGSTVTTIYQYDNPLHMQPTVVSTILEDAGTNSQHVLKTSLRYPQDYTFNGTLSGSAAALKTLVDKHMISVPIEQVKLSARGSVSRYIDGQITIYKMNGTAVVKDKDYNLKFNGSTIYQDLITYTPASINTSGQFIYDSHYEQFNSYNRYDTSNNLLEITDRKITTCLIREPNTGNVWAQVKNCNYAGTAYSSFEHTTPSTFTNWSYNVAGITTSGSQSGLKAFNLSGNPINTIQALINTQKYKVSFWRKVSGGATFSVKASGVTVTLRTGPQRNGWQYYEGIFTGATTVQITGDATIDDLRLYPQNAQMISYTYKDGVGQTSQCNENNQYTFWDYDDLNRLKLTKDQDGNILKKNEYQYQYIQN